MRCKIDQLERDACFATRIPPSSAVSFGLIDYSRVDPKYESRSTRWSPATRNRAPLGPYSRTMPRALWWPQGGGRFLMSEVLLTTLNPKSENREQVDTLEPGDNPRSLSALSARLRFCPKPETRSPKPHPIHQNPKSKIANSNPETAPLRFLPEYKSSNCSPGQPETRNPKPELRNPTPEIGNSRPETTNPKPEPQTCAQRQPALSLHTLGAPPVFGFAVVDVRSRVDNSGSSCDAPGFSLCRVSLGIYPRVG